MTSEVIMSPMRTTLVLAACLATTLTVAAHDATQDPAPPPISATCWGDAPTITTCDLGSHVTVLPLQRSNSFAWAGARDDAPTTATIEIRWTWVDAAGLAHSGWERIDVAGGLPAAGTVGASHTRGGEPVPPILVAYQVGCSSFDLGTSTPGGSGRFACIHRHDELTPSP